MPIDLVVFPLPMPLDAARRARTPIVRLTHDRVKWHGPWNSSLPAAPAAPRRLWSASFGRARRSPEAVRCQSGIRSHGRHRYGAPNPACDIGRRAVTRGDRSRDGRAQRRPAQQNVTLWPPTLRRLDLVEQSTIT